MISCDLIGQTGNQMFQIATTMALALDNNDSFKIPPCSINKKLWPLFYKHLPILSEQEKIQISYVYKERDFEYNAIPYTPGMKIHGYFQSEKYFAHRRQEVINIFKKEWPALKAKPATVGIHIRRGDYLKYPTKHISPSIDYIRDGMRFFPNHNFLFFSDDIAWCKEKFHGAECSEGKNTLEDMALLSSCDHQIISASTFSWWAAWMNENPNKKIIAPATWFGPDNAHLNPKDIIPSSWQKI